MSVNGKGAARLSRLGTLARENARNPNALVFVAMGIVAVLFPAFASFVVPDQSNVLISQAADAGVYILLALGLNVVIGFAGLLDLGYAAFFAIGAYTYAMLASGQLAQTPYGHAVHLPFWLLLFVGVVIAAGAGALLGAPTLRLRGDYLAIVTLGFGEIVPRLFRNGGQWTGGVNAISAIDAPTFPFWFDGPWNNGADFQVLTNFKFTSGSAVPWYVLMVVLLVFAIILVRNLQNSRLGRAWMAIREDEGAAAAMGINTRNVKLLAFSMGAATSGFAGCYYGAKLGLVSPENFSFIVSVTILMMVTLGGMGNIPGVIVGAVLIYFVEFKFLTDLPGWVTAVTDNVGLGAAHNQINTFASQLNFLVLGLILVLTMLLRPQGLVPSRVRQQELTEHDPAVPVVGGGGGS
jgi:branched-chain amino acid transport system permease protein